MRSIMPTQTAESNGFQQEENQALFSSESNQAHLLTQQQNHEYASNELLALQNEQIWQEQMKAKDAYILQLQEQIQ